MVTYWLIIEIEKLYSNFVEPRAATYHNHQIIIECCKFVLNSVSMTSRIIFMVLASREIMKKKANPLVEGCFMTLLVAC